MTFADVLVRSGIVPPEQLAELRRWKVPGLPDEGSEAGPPSELNQTTLDVIRDELEEVLQSKDLVEVRVTDPDLLQQYIATQHAAVLHVQAGTQEAEFDVIFGLHSSGAVVLPWSSQALEDAVVKGDAWLLVDGREIHFSDTTTYFYGEKKAFLVCTPSQAT